VLGQAEVGHVRLAVAIDQNVGRLEVAVDDAALVRVMDSPRLSTSDNPLRRRPQRPETDARNGRKRIGQRNLLHSFILGKIVSVTLGHPP
jgi:hypothetical protein